MAESGRTGFRELLLTCLHLKITIIRIAIGLILVRTAPGNAQELNLLTPEVISSKDGLPQAFVPDIVQDSQGFIWMATRDGLCRYDGTRLKIFRPDPLGKPSLSFTGIIKMQLDTKGKIWILTEKNSIDVFDPITEKFDNISKRPIFQEFLKENFVHQILVDSKGRFWIANLLKGVTCFDVALNKTKFYPFSKEEKEFFIGNQVVSMTEVEGIVWMSTPRNLSLFDEKAQKFTPYANPRRELVLGSNTMIKSLQSRKKTGELMIGTADSFILLDVATGRAKEYKLPRKLVDGLSVLVSDNEGAIYSSNQGLLLKFSETAGLQILEDFSREHWDCNSLFIDQSGVLWMGTNGSGVRKYNLRKGAFQNFAYRKDFSRDLLGIWYKIPPERQPATNSRFTGYQFRYAIDKKRKVTWYSFGGTDTSIYELDDSTQVIRLHRLPLDTVNHEAVYPIAVDGAGNVFASSGADILQFSDSLKRFVKTGIRLDPGRTGFFFQMMADNNDFWFITWDMGLLKYHRKTGKATRLVHDPKNSKSLSSNTLYCISNDPLDPNRLWVGTFGSGLCALDKRTGECRRITTDNGLSNNVIYSAIPDGQGYVWIGTNQGLNRMHHKTFKIRTYTADDGIMADEFNRYHYLQLPDGRIVMGGIDGFTGFDPRKLKDDVFQPRVELVSLAINNQMVNPGSPALGELPVHLLKDLSLSYRQNFLTFDFAALQYNEPRRNRFRYQLEGVNETWIESDQPRGVYTELRPGSYTLRLNASNTSGLWSRDVRLLHITVHPPVWATWWAYGLYFLLALGILYWSFRIYLNRLKMQQQMILNQRETEQLKAADEMKTRFFSNVTHEFRTPLTLIMAPAEQLKMKLKDQDDQKRLTSINRNANQLLELINQLLDLSKLEAGALPVHELQGDLSSFVKQTVELFEQQAQSGEIVLVFENKNVTGDYFFDAEKIERIVQNLVFNALKFTKRGGSVSVTLEQGDGLVRLAVNDTGVGIPKEKLNSIFERFYQAEGQGTGQQQGTGIGLALVREIAGLLNGRIAVESEVGKGTSFRVELPLKPAVTSHPVPVTMHSEEPAMALEETRVLIVEDNPELSGYISTSLPESYKISFAADGEEGLEKALNELPDLIISDVLMPSMDGLTLCGKLKEDIRTGHIPVILLTARSTFEDRIAGLEKGADDYLAKPFKIKELQLRVRNLLESKRKQREWIHADFLTPKENTAPKPAPDPFLQDLYKLMDLHLDDSTFGVEQLSERMRISRIHLYRKIKTLTGFTATEFLRNYRLKQAIGFLKAGYPVSEAGYMVGFETPSYFTKCFRDVYQLTPTEFLGQKTAEK